MLRERVEAEIDRVIAPLFDGLEAERSVVVGNGPSAYVETVEDIPTRIAAARELLDRSYGKPKQQVEHSGDRDAPVRVEVSAEVSRAAHEFLDRVRQARGG